MGDDLGLHQGARPAAGRLERAVELMRRETSGDPVREARAWADRLAEVNRKRGGYLDLAAEGIMSRDELRAKLAALDETRAAAEREWAAVRDQAARLDEFEREAEMVLEAYTQVTPEALDALAPEQWQQFYRVLGLRVTAHQDAPPEIDGTFVVDGALKAVEQPFRSSDTASACQSQNTKLLELGFRVWLTEDGARHLELVRA